LQNSFYLLLIDEHLEVKAALDPDSVLEFGIRLMSLSRKKLLLQAATLDLAGASQCRPFLE
jgi:hypothetical protein